MSDKVPYEGIIKSLKSLVTLDIVFLLFSFVCAANIFLNRGYQMPATSATISYIQAQVKPASGILFLCAFGMFMTGGMGLIKLALWRSVLPKLSPGEDAPKEHVHWATDVLATANIERNAYLLRVYEEHRDANNELAWLSRLAQSCLVLAVIDGFIRDVIPRLYGFQMTLTYIKGKSAIHLARTYGDRKRNFVGQNFWARGFLVSTVGRDEGLIRTYIRDQDEEDRRLDQLKIWE